MKFIQPKAQIYIPDNAHEETALARTTHMGISAHQDDLEIMAVDGILACFQQQEKWFTGVVVTDGRGSPRNGLYENYTDDEMMLVRVKEQKKAAYIGEYSAQVFLDYPSSAVKNKSELKPVADLAELIKACRPQIIYTHNLADKHETHVGVALKTIQAIRQLPADQRPQHIYGCEVWRDLDWLVDEDKVVFDCSAQENMQSALVGVFDSQVTGGKRYDLATLARRRANATYFATHGVDISTGMTYAMDLTPLVVDPTLDIAAYVERYIERFAAAVLQRLK
jgi:LmbE family N-acetylglucosaminyl deacetylase